jgi:hypothetical protein
MRRTALFASLLLFAAIASAEDGARVAPGSESQAPVVLRLSADGEWLGVSRSDAGDAPVIMVAPLQPSLRQPYPAALTIGGLFAFPGGDGPRAVASASRQQTLPLALTALPPAWCQGVVGMVANAADCAPQALPGLAPQPTLTREQASIGWAGPKADLTLGLGHQQGWAAGGSGWLLATPGTATLLAPTGRIDGHDLSLSGLWRVAPWGGLTLSASVGETNWQVLPGTAPLALDQAALQLGVVRGAFSGGITGRVIRPGDTDDTLWSGLDIGISWRTPWRGELAIGAQNLIGRGGDALPAPTSPALDEATARTPYVRYTQDL